MLFCDSASSTSLDIHSSPTLTAQLQVATAHCAHHRAVSPSMHAGKPRVMLAQLRPAATCMRRSVSLEIVVQIHFLQTKMCHVQIEEPQVVVRSDCRSEFSANPYLQCMHSFLKHYQNSHCNTSKTPPSSAD
jgi:hypothetical protein